MQAAAQRRAIAAVRRRREMGWNGRRGEDTTKFGGWGKSYSRWESKPNGAQRTSAGVPRAVGWGLQRVEAWMIQRRGCCSMACRLYRSGAAFFADHAAAEVSECSSLFFLDKTRDMIDMLKVIQSYGSVVH